jgi:hypothetical protein
MSNLSRTLVAAAAVALLGASVASAQTPGLRGSIGVRPVTTVSPIPAMQMQQELAWQNAYRQAQLWQMYNPPVVIVNNPWANYNTWSSYNTPGAIWNSNNSFYRNTNPTWGNQPGLNRPFR